VGVQVLPDVQNLFICFKNINMIISISVFISSVIFILYLVFNGVNKNLKLTDYQNDFDKETEYKKIKKWKGPPDW
jgi:hypothetical protein